MSNQPAHHDPTPGEIRRRCREIQREWGPWTRYSRSGGWDLAALLEAEAEGNPAAADVMRREHMVPPVASGDAFTY